MPRKPRREIRALGWGYLPVGNTVPEAPYRGEPTAPYVGYVRTTGGEVDGPRMATADEARSWAFGRYQKIRGVRASRHRHRYPSEHIGNCDLACREGRRIHFHRVGVKR